VPAELCECTSDLTILQCRQRVVFVADGPAFGTRNHFLEYLPTAPGVPTCGRI
jgi:hypothetical protein